MIRISKRTQNKVVSQLKHFQNLIREAKQKDINERDTVNLLRNFLTQCLGYDNYSEISSEKQIRGTYCDLIIEPNDSVHKFLIEVKRIGSELNIGHARQAMHYSIDSGIHWVVLTNANEWQLFHVESSERPLVMKFNILDLNHRSKECVEKLLMFSKEGFLKSSFDVLYSKNRTMNKHLIGALLMHESSLRLLRSRKSLVIHEPGITRDFLKDNVEWWGEGVFRSGIEMR